jgi:hypothetical protein
LHDIELGAAEHFLQGHRSAHLTRQVRIVELVGVANALVRDELEILAAEGVTVSRSEIGERHFVGAPHFRLQMVDLAGEAVGRQPFGHRIGIEKRPIHSFRRRADDAVEPHGIGRHEDSPFDEEWKRPPSIASAMEGEPAASRCIS